MTWLMLSVNGRSICILHEEGSKVSKSEERLVSIEVACALPDRQRVIPLSVPGGSTVAEAVDASGITELFPELEMDSVTFGIFERQVTPETLVSEGDRVTLLRPLLIDPKEQRRRRALRQKSNRQQ